MNYWFHRIILQLIKLQNCLNSANIIQLLNLLNLSQKGQRIQCKLQFYLNKYLTKVSYSLFIAESQSAELHFLFQARFLIKTLIDNYMEGPRKLKANPLRRAALWFENRIQDILNEGRGCLQERLIQCVANSHSFIHSDVSLSTL
jgi:hypothetical protein